MRIESLLCDENYMSYKLVNDELGISHLICVFIFYKIPFVERYNVMFIFYAGLLVH